MKRTRIKKYTGKVNDYKIETSVILHFRKGQDSILLSQVDSYLKSVNNPLTFLELHETLPLNDRLTILTEAYRSDFTK